MTIEGEVQLQMSPDTFYAGKTVAITGGASFIGSHLVDRLVPLCERVVVVDDFSSGRREHLSAHEGAIDIREGDLAERETAAKTIDRADVVFHLAAVHGGRGFIETYPLKMLVNLAIDHNVFAASADAGAEVVVHASSACTYPLALQEDVDGRSLLAEPSAGFEVPEQSFPDGTYGWIKLMGEYQCKVAAEAGAFRGRSARIFTAYGERENESHAAVALIAKALLQADPYPIWGSGLQTRNFTYVGDTVTGLMALASDQSGAAYDAFNIGSSEHHTVMDFVECVFDVVGWRPNEIDRQIDKPVGVGNRASDNTKILEHFAWEPSTALRTGIERTVEWYRNEPTRAQTLDDLESRLLAR